MEKRVIKKYEFMGLIDLKLLKDNYIKKEKGLNDWDGVLKLIEDIQIYFDGGDLTPEEKSMGIKNVINTHAELVLRKRKFKY